jgi:hypothetical protein
LDRWSRSTDARLQQDARLVPGVLASFMEDDLAPDRIGCVHLVRPGIVDPFP